jgi:hypothetical protein
MSYVIAAYAIVLVCLGTYAWRLGARVREAGRRSPPRTEAPVPGAEHPATAANSTPFRK